MLIGRWLVLAIRWYTRSTSSGAAAPSSSGPSYGADGVDEPPLLEGEPTRPANTMLDPFHCCCSSFLSPPLPLPPSSKVGVSEAGTREDVLELCQCID